MTVDELAKMFGQLQQRVKDLESQLKRKKKPPPTDFDPTKIIGLDVKAWQKWIDYRIKIKKPLKPVSYELAAKKLAKHGSGQMAAVEHSMAEGYQGCFAEREATNGNSAPSRDRWANVRKGTTNEDCGFG